MKQILAVMLSVSAMAAGGHAAAQTTYPKSIRTVIGFPPGSPVATAARPSSFTEEYREWKVGHNMSTFRAEQDADVLAAVAAGDCAYANSAIFQYGRVHLPGADAYDDAQVIAYGGTVDKLVDACQRDKTARITPIK